MSTTERYDVIIIGTGAGGGTLSHRLAPSGKKILLLERGDRIVREKQNWSSKAVLLENRYKAHETFRDKDGKEFHPGIHYNVGGNTKVYGAALLRMRERDFGVLAHRDGVSPAWPLAYDEFESYYTEAEHLYHVHGERGADPTEPRASAPYRFKPVRHEPRIQELFEDLTRCGHRPFPLPVGVLLDEDRPEKSACIKCETCDGFPCLVNAKADAQTICVEPALQHSNVTLLTNALVEKLETSASGREIERVVVQRDGKREEYAASIVVLAAGAIDSAALLLRSRNDRHRNGLANGSGVVGRFYMCHNNSALLAISKKPNPTRFQKTLGLNDFYFGAEDDDFPLGHIAMLGKSDEDALRSGAPKFAPGMALDQMAKHSLDFWISSEDLPDPENRVTLESDGRVRLAYRENNVESHRKLIGKLKGMLNRIGCEDHLFPQNLYLGKKIPIAGTAHQCGTVRFGTDPKTSALDVNCRAHEVDNLYVADSSFFVSSSAVNPALTIMANAMRVGDHLLERLQ